MMKLKEFAENINKILAERPETAEMIVIYSIDDEGNAFNRIRCEPSVGGYDGYDFDGESESNAVCIN